MMEIESQSNILTPSGSLVIQSPSELDILREIVKYDEDVIRHALGDFGLRLRDFSKTIDSNHPEVKSLSELNVHSGKFCQLLKLAEYACKEGLLDALDGLSKIHTKHLPRTLKCIDTPFRTQRFVRLLPSQDAREEVRRTKSVREIDLHTFKSRGQVVWDSQPNDFAIYTRHNTLYKVEIAKAEKKAERYRSLGLLEMAKRIDETIETFREMIEDMYYGFHRLTMTNAAVIAAKINGFHLWAPEKDQNGSTKDAPVKPYRIAVPGEIIDECFKIKSSNQCYEYSPRAYPLAEIDFVSEQIRDTIDRLENFSDAGNKAIFDHYVVVVPSVRWPYKKSPIIVNSVNQKIIHGFNNPEGGQYKTSEFPYFLSYKEMDTILIKEKAVIPVLLGERDGKCYFICNFK